jgi:hypothetical protein
MAKIECVFMVLLITRPGEDSSSPKMQGAIKDAHQTVDGWAEASTDRAGRARQF